MRTRFVSFLLLIAALSFSGCKKDKYPIRPIDVETQIVIDADTPVDYTGCTVVTLQGEFVIEDGNVSGTISRASGGHAGAFRGALPRS